LSAAVRGGDAEMVKLLLKVDMLNVNGTERRDYDAHRNAGQTAL
jgi:hypothetical protein